MQRDPGHGPQPIPDSPSLSGVVSARAAASALGVHEKTIRRAIARGDLAAVKQGRSFQITTEALERYQRAPSRAHHAPRAIAPPTEELTRPVLVAVPRITPARLPSLPAPLTSFIGREREAAAVADLVRRDDVRLVTLTGPGGVGKTRLTLFVAEEVGAAFADGLAFVELAPVRSPTHVLAAVASTVGVPDLGKRPLRDSLVSILGERDMLLILDNFEHVLPAAPLIADLLTRCPRLRVLASSRAPLGVAGERLWPVSPLAVPPEGHAGPDFGPAVALFVERAQAVVPGFALTEANAPVVAAICQRVDGLPLAIELAAARTSVLSLPDLYARLSRQLAVLRGGPRDQPPRLRAMADAVAWSYDLLAPSEQALFRRLAIFIGGFGLDAAEAVWGSEGEEALDLLTALVDQSLIHRATGPAGATRYAMLETIRDYGLERLVASGEEGAVRQAHATYFARMSQAAAVGLVPPNLRQWLPRVEADIANIRAALDWLQSHGQIAEALRLMTNLTRFWLQPPHTAEGRTWFTTLLPLAGSEITPAILARALLSAAGIAILQRDYEAAEPLSEWALALFRAIGDDRHTCAALGTVGYLAMDQGRLDDAVTLLTEARALAITSGCSWDATEAMNNLARVATERGDWGEAIALHGESLAEWQRLGDDDNVASALGSLAWLYRATGDVGRAHDAYRTVLDYAVEHHQPYAIAAYLTGYASLALGHGQHAPAVRLFAATDAQFRKLGTPLPRNYQRANDAMVAELRQRLGEAAFTAAWLGGQQLTLTEAVAEARALPRPSDPPIALTPREVEVLRLVAAGMSDKEIGSAVGISRHTVSNHLRTIRAKLGVPSRAAAAVLALRDGLV